ncbi:hypothetical protein LZ32DRAFT_689981 [Colletotrichum eremochloae]|nr:hypothetical protein LZ32DRAFT_689981 [Colletotrichum eremochloae]
MHKVYNGGRTIHSNDILTTVSQYLIQEPDEMLIMNREPFAPFRWTPDINIHLFGIHNETSNLESHNPGYELPFHEELDGLPDHPKGVPSWVHDWSMTYLVHAFSPARNNNLVKGFKHVTPSYVLSR